MKTWQVILALLVGLVAWPITRACAQTQPTTTQLAGGSIVVVLLADGSGKLVVGQFAGNVVIDWTTTPPTVAFSAPAALVAVETRLKATADPLAWTAAATTCGRVHRHGIRLLAGLDYATTAAAGVVTVTMTALQGAQPDDIMLAECVPVSDLGVRK